jgi:type I restriction enzyme S subunit
LDEAVASLRHAKANLKRYKASLLKAAVEGRLTEQWRKEHSDVEPAEKLLEHILTERRKKWDQAELSRLRAKGKETKDGKLNGEYQEPQPPDVENLPDIPASWIWARLDALTDIKGGITKDSKRKIRNARSLPYLRVANVQRGYLELTEMKNIEVPVDQVNELLLEVGDILFNEGGDRDKLGRGWIWEGKIRECTYQNHVFRARPYLKGLQGRFISWFGNTSGKQFFVAKGKQTTNLASVNKTMLSSFPIPLPPLSEQAAIVMEVERRLTISNEMEREMEINLRKAERLRQSVLKRAFSGRLFAMNLNHKGIDTPVVTVNRGDHHLGLKIHNR